MPKGIEPWNKGLTKEDDKRIKRIGLINSKKMKLLWQNPDYRKSQLAKVGLNQKNGIPWNKGVKMWKTNPNHWAHTKKRKIVSKQISKNKKGVRVPLERRRRISKTVTKLHEKGVYSDELKKRMMKARSKALHGRPTKPEQSMIKLLKSLGLRNFGYTGDGTRYINGRFPDFVNDKEHKIIEVFGVHWHETEEVKPRIERFKQIGFDTLIVWDYELDDIERVEQKLLLFANGMI